MREDTNPELGPENMAKAIELATTAMSDVYARTTTGERAGFCHLIENLISPSFDNDMGLVNDLSSVINVKFWSQFLDRIRNPRVSMAQSIDWLSTATIEMLLAEATEYNILEPNRGLPGADRNNSVARSLLGRQGRFLDWAKEQMCVDFADELEFTYLKYVGDGHYCRAHVDRPESYEYNCLVCLQHSVENSNTTSSSLCLFEYECSNYYDIPVGGAIIFHSAATIHGRTRLHPGETLHLLSIGLTAKVAGSRAYSSG